MAGPTTEVLNDDLKAVREDLHKFQVAITADVRELSTKMAGILSTLRLLGVLVLTSIAGSIWWGATLNARVGTLETQFGRLESRLDKFEAKVDARFDRLEASIARLVEQTRPATAK